MAYRASTSVSLTFVARRPDGSEIPVDEDGLPIITISMEADETTGAFGEKLPFRVFIAPAGTAYTLENSAFGVGGQTYPEAGGTIEGQQVVSFVGSKTASLSAPIDELVSTEWLGTDLGAVAIAGNQVTCSREGVSNLKVVYRRNYFGHSIMVPQQSTTPFPVTVVAYVS